MNETNNSNSFIPKRIADIIYTQDLAYSNPEGKYSFRFNYLGEGIFSLKSLGYIDEKSFRIQLQYGDKARERLQELMPDVPFHLLWDVSDITGISLISRSILFSRVTTIGDVTSVSILGANGFIRNFSKLFNRLVPWVKFFYFDTLEEALENVKRVFQKVSNELIENTISTSNTRKSLSFIRLWEDDRNFLDTGSKKLRVIHDPDWEYTSDSQSFAVKVSVVEGNIIYYECEGFARTHHVEKTYAIMESIMNRMSYNSTFNKFYSVLNLRKLKGVTLAGRRMLAYYEKLHHNKAHLVLIIPPPLLKMFIKVAHALDYDNFAHWDSMPSLEAAFERIEEHRNGHYESFPKGRTTMTSGTLSIPRNSSKRLALIRKLQEEIHLLKSNQQREIDKILEIAGRMTWDDTFSDEILIPESSNPFGDIYAALNILFLDFKEILHEKTSHASQLKESEDKYKNLVSLATDVIAVFQDGIIKYVNSAIQQVLGYSPEEIIGQPMNAYVTAEEKVRLETFHQKRLKGEDVPSFYETIFLHKNGQQVPISMSVGAIEYEKKTAVMLIARDMTQKKKTEEELARYRNHLEDIIRDRTEQLQKEINDRKIAEESDRLKTAFLSNMSHEIRTPMNAIISFSRFLREPEISKEEHDEYLNHIQSSGETLLHLINDIIDISKIEAHQLQIQESFSSIDPVLDELHLYFEKQLQNLGKHEVNLTLEIPDRNQILQLYTDVFRLRQILTNLIDNAIKFTDYGFVKFGYKLENENVIFYVQDSGTGIPKDKLPLLFKRFGKIELSGRNVGGTGLGLAISHNLASLLHGILRVETREGKGSIFYLEMPFRKVTEPQVTQKPMEKTFREHYNWENKNILIVEDEDLNFRVLQITLRSTRANIIRAVNGKDALDKLQECGTIDLVLMDIQMPIMDGYEALSLLKQSHPRMPVIAQTAFAMMEEKKHCLDLGFDDYISKPIKFDELLVKVDRLLERSVPD